MTKVFLGGGQEAALVVMLILMRCQRRETRMGRPPWGWVVSFWTGQGYVSGSVSKRKRERRMASAMTASCMAKLAPMHTRGPAPKGRY